MLAFLGQAAVGLGLTRAPGFPDAIGWVVVAWNIGWLVVLPVATPGDLYYPFLHHLLLPAVGIPLLATAVAH